MIEHPRYEVGPLVGEGAQGRVVRVIDRERPALPLVAKVLAGRAAGSEARLAGEFALLARLRIPGLVRVHDFARDARGTPFIVEDFVEGAPPRADDPRRLVVLACDLAETLGALHDAGFVHGDVKPDNVRVASAGRAMLLDLGAAMGDGVHTRAFAAPEVRAGARPTRASDLYSLGATLRACATKLPPSVGDLLARLCADHPADRPSSALDVVAALGRTRAALAWEGASRGRHVHEDAVRRALATKAPVLYVSGPGGAGKSHVAREIVTRALLEGRDARIVRFPEADAELGARLLAWLRGGPSPFGASPSKLVVLDGVEAAPTEIVEALEARRCRSPGDEVTVVAAIRQAPNDATCIHLPPLDGDALERLFDDLRVPRADRAGLARESGGLPGWIAGALGRVPLAKDAVLARVAELSPEARADLALVATMGGEAPADALDPSACFAAGLLVREAHRIRLGSIALAGDVASALGDFAVSDRAAAIALARGDLSASSLAAIARAPSPPAERNAVLAAAAERARREEARALEIDMLLALVADPRERTSARLARLERLTRDAGIARAHPQVLEWIETRDDLAVLAARRRAEALARRGDLTSARTAAERAVAIATPADSAYAWSTRGAIALWSADWAAAEAAFACAREALAAAAPDAEEVARLDHNAGVVALYRGRHDEAAEAFERAIATKRALGDRAGVRACLLNLGLARTRQRRFDESERALVEALALAESLGQLAGKGWSLAARADLELRRGRPRDAERFVAEAEAIGDAVPKTVRADLALLRAEIALLGGDARGAFAALATIDAALRADDAMIDARALVAAAKAWCVALPADRRRAAKTAIAAVRRARAAELADVEGEALAALRAARGRQEPRREVRAMNDATWQLLEVFARDDVDASALRLLRAIVVEAAAERAFLVGLDGRTWGVDVDGLAISEPERRVDGAAIAAAPRGATPVYQPDVESPAGRGSRLIAPGAHATVVVEQRFARGAFDRVAAERAMQWAVLADVVARLGGVAASAPASVSSRSVDPMSTAVPRREAMREYPEIVGRSPALRRALAQLDAAVDTDLPVLVRGETGTGKELFARALHDHGARASGPFVAVNCAAIADALFEAELFGHAKGAFTGADRARAGLLARAEGGTLLLDEIGELPLARQATLLRVLESRRFRPVGSDDERAFEVRIIAATNRDLDAGVEEGVFRNDLLYRLRVLEIVVPPLRERRGDVEILLRHFLARAGARVAVSPAALEALDAYAFPGNVRELSHHAARLAASGVARIDVAHLPRAVRQAFAEGPSREDGERAEVERALSRTSGNISRAAALLGITRHGLKKRMLRLGLRAKGTAG